VRVDADLFASKGTVLHSTGPIDLQRELQRPIEDVLAKRQGIINWALESEIAGADMALKLETLDAQREELVATWESNFY
jgi:hypothetical protein